ncbi:hypothetical protein HMPREF3001_17485 [Enterococcus sp. HMSC066C04]|nr:hypothetical protein HMPREF3001_17485 [Enterococcus sp. HMSC066C04]
MKNPRIIGFSKKVERKKSAKFSPNAIFSTLKTMNFYAFDIILDMKGICIFLLREFKMRKKCKFILLNVFLIISRCEKR